MQKSLKLEMFVGLTTNHGYIITEQEINEAKKLINQHFTCFTVAEGTGVWNGIEEKCLVFTVITSDKTDVSVFTDMAKMIRISWEQDAILVGVTELNSILINSDNGIPEKFNAQELETKTKASLVVLAVRWGKNISEARNLKEVDLRQYVLWKQYTNQGTRTSGIVAGVGTN